MPLRNGHIILWASSSAPAEPPLFIFIITLLLSPYWRSNWRSSLKITVMIMIENWKIKTCFRDKNHKIRHGNLFGEEISPEFSYHTQTILAKSKTELNKKEKLYFRLLNIKKYHHCLNKIRTDWSNSTGWSTTKEKF